jgi:hypothetical protein
MRTAEEILADPSRVHCKPYAANLSREACLKQQEVAKKQRQSWGYGSFLEPRDPCLKCRQGREIKAILANPHNTGVLNGQLNHNSSPRGETPARGK